MGEIAIKQQRAAWNFYRRELIHFMIGDALQTSVYTDISHYRLYDVDNVNVAWDDLNDLARVYGYDIHNVLILLPWLMTCPPIPLWQEGLTRDQVRQLYNSRQPARIGISVQYPLIDFCEFKQFRLSKTYFIDPNDPESQDDCRFYCPENLDEAWDDIVEFAKENHCDLQDLMPLFAHIAENGPIELLTKTPAFNLPHFCQFLFGRSLIRGHFMPGRSGFTFIAADCH